MAGNDYQIDFSAADSTLYDRLFPQQISTLPVGRESDPLNNATAIDSVESLAPANLALGQIVPFEFRITADSAGSVYGDTITVTAGWETATTNGGLFGYDGNLGVIAAFIDASDPSASNDTDATVSNFSWNLVGTEIQGTFEITNLDPGKEIVLEAWVVLQDEIPVGTTGNVQSRLIGAETSGAIESGDKINTGNQTIPLLRVKDFFSTSADLSVVVGDSDVVTVQDDSAEVSIGEQFTYTILATNNSDAVANQVVLTDNLDPNVKFIAAKITDNEGAITTVSHDDSTSGGILTGDLGFLNPGEEVAIEVTVEVLDTSPTGGIGDLSNTVTITSINDDPNSGNNTNIELTDVIGTENYSIESEVDNNTTAPGVFTVGDTGQIEYDFLYDGGWFQGELAVFSLAGMEAYEYGSLDYLQEAAARAVSNSTQGRILTSDRDEGAHFDFAVSWEKNFNKGDYQGTKTFAMNPGDEVGFMLVQHTTFANIYSNPNHTSQWGKKVLFSTDSNQIAAVDNNGIFGYEDVRVDADNPDYDYNDFVFQVAGLTGNVDSMDELVNPTRDWRSTAMGQQLLNHANGETFTEGVFEVGATGEVIIDYLYDGGWYESEVGIFSLEGMDAYDLNSNAFATEAINRALSNSEQGYVVIQDPLEGARYSDLLKWEKNFNQGEYSGRQIFQMNPGDKFGLVLIPDTTLEDALLASDWETKKQPFFSITAANQDNTVQIGTVYDDVNGVIVGWEDVPRLRGSNQDYNDIVLAIEGADAIGINAIEDLINNGRNWLDKPVGQEIVSYFDNYSLV
ncbi:DUF4114 domain-containing protein [Myxosarcina sp. GI1]|uniref:DUF4114 domain-containing protein n=1 Tax=Myxosarcina sp. GI1 TaxID=1541065 RepID=UPI00068D5BDE|nr:DUF4114 domain-containing protein [Myxosarcina sp. GI1]